jgi:hypothetical protein
VSRNRRGKELTCIYTDERPDLARELPNWMFKEKHCASMSLGPPQVSIEALDALAALQAAGGKSAKRGSRSRPSEAKEAIRASDDGVSLAASVSGRSRRRQAQKADRNRRGGRNLHP